MSESLTKTCTAAEFVLAQASVSRRVPAGGHTVQIEIDVPRPLVVDAAHTIGAVDVVPIRCPVADTHGVVERIREFAGEIVRQSFFDRDRLRDADGKRERGEHECDSGQSKGQVSDGAPKSLHVQRASLKDDQSKPSRVAALSPAAPGRQFNQGGMP